MRKTLQPGQTVAVIGPGRLGTALALALSRQGYRLKALVGRHLSSTKKAARYLDATPQLLVAREMKMLPKTKLVVITTPDDQIETVATQLGKLKIDKRSPPVAFHTSGALSSAILKPMADKGWSTGSMHPLVAVSNPEAGAESLRGCFWCIEGSAKANTQARKLVSALNGQSFTIRAEVKPLYHAAAVMTSGNVVALFDVAVDMLTHCGLPSDMAQRILLPLLESTSANLNKYTPAKAMTGTFARGDLATVAAHLRAISGARLDDALNLYRLLGRHALELALKNGLSVNKQQLIAEKLEG